MPRFGTFLYGEELFDGSGSGVADFSVRVPWLLRELHSGDEYEFAVNPLDCDMPTQEKPITTQYTASGQPINFEGNPLPQRISFSGTILTEAHLNAMVLWTNKKSQILLTDDLNQNFFIYISQFSPTRQYHPAFPWRHEYSAAGTVLSWQ